MVVSMDKFELSTNYIDPSSTTSTLLYGDTAAQVLLNLGYHHVTVDDTGRASCYDVENNYQPSLYVYKKFNTMMLHGFNRTTQ